MPNVLGSRKVRRYFMVLFGLAISLAFLLAACQGPEDASEETPTSGTVVPATATPALTPVPVPTATAASSPAAVVPAPTGTAEGPETQAPIEEEFKTYLDGLYGYSVRIPETWTASRPTTGPRGIVTVFDTGDEDVEARILVLYREEPTPADEVAMNQVSSLAGLSGFKTITEAWLAIEDGAEVYQTLYGFGTGSNEVRGVLTFVAKGTVNIGLQVQAPRIKYERNFDALDKFATSLAIEDLQPFGVPREEALVLYLDFGPLTMDPALATESGSAQYIGHIFGGLVRLNDDLEPAEDLATWAVSDDGLTYTFTIKEGGTFHDGSPVTANDVVYSWERALSPDLTIPGGALPYLDDIVGAHEYASGEADSISGVTTQGDNTLIVTIDAPKSYFLSKLSHTYAAVIQEATVYEAPPPTAPGSETDADDRAVVNPWWYTAIGTGPYQLEEFVQGRAMHLRAYEGYHGEQPNVRDVVYLFHSGLPVPMIQEGVVDATTLSLRSYQALQEEENTLLDNVAVTPALSVSYLGFNTTIAPFNDPDVRRAFLWSLDREAIYGDDAEEVAIAQGFMPPGLPGYDENIAAIPYAPERAKALFDRTGYGQMEDRPAIVVALGGEISPIQRVAFAMWEENLGVRIVYAEYGQGYFYNLSRILKGNEDTIGANIYEYGWIADYPDPHNFLDTLFHTGSEKNAGKAGSPEIDALLEKARTAGDDRLELYQQIERALVEEAVAVPLQFGADYLLVADRVRNLFVNAQGFLNVSDVELDS